MLVTVWEWLVVGSWLSASALGLLGLVPIRVADDAETSEQLAALVRRAAWAIVILVGVGLALWAGLLSPAAVADPAKRLMLGLLLVYSAGLIVRATVGRYLAPWFSAWWGARKIGQEIERKSDIREKLNRQPKQFEPEAHFGEHMFFGLCDDGLPYTVPLKTFRGMHCQFLGATGTGKGVLLQNVMAQSIRLGYGAWYFDPKSDGYIRTLLADEARRSGRPFYILDLVNGIGSYAPFACGSVDARAERLTTLFGLARGGGDSDYYKNNERAILRRTLKAVSAERATLQALEKEFTKQKKAHFGADNRRAGDVMTAESLLSEWQALPTICVTPTAATLDVRRAVREGAVVYVRSALSGLSIDVATACLVELSEVLIADPPSARGQHIVVGIDETERLLTQTVLTGLTVLRSCGTTMLLAYQSADQARNLRDQRVDKEAAKGIIEVNCQIKLVYGTTNDAVAEQISLDSGDRRVMALMSQRAETNAFGGEAWTGERTIKEDRAPVISKDEIKALPERVAVALRPNALAQVVSTCWLPGRSEEAYEAAVRSWEERSKIVDAPAETKRIAFDVPKRPQKTKSKPSAEGQVAGAEVAPMEGSEGVVDRAVDDGWAS